jgi:hypothetical protein
VDYEGAIGAPGCRSVVSTPFALTLLAAICAKLGRTTEGLDYLTEAEQITEAANDRFHEAELHRVRGDLLSGIGDPAEPSAATNTHYVVLR